MIDLALYGKLWSSISNMILLILEASMHKRLILAHNMTTSLLHSCSSNGKAYAKVMDSIPWKCVQWKKKCLNSMSFALEKCITKFINASVCQAQNISKKYCIKTVYMTCALHLKSFETIWLICEENSFNLKHHCKINIIDCRMQACQFKKCFSSH